MSYYELLNVEIHSDFAEIKRAYFKRAKACHPDRFNNSKAKEEEFKRVVDAFDTLSDPEKRLRYDKIHCLDQDQNEDQARHGSFVETFSSDSIMDSAADDILEELIVGNSPPPDSTLSTLLSDLENTKVFINFREGKNLFFDREYAKALVRFKQAIAYAPDNILYRCFTARTYAFMRKYGKAKTHYRSAIALGERRTPPQHLARIRRELEEVNKKHFPLLHALKSFFGEAKGPLFLKPTGEKMIEETNRAINNLMAEQKRENRKKLSE